MRSSFALMGKARGEARSFAGIAVIATNLHGLYPTPFTCPAEKKPWQGFIQKNHDPKAITTPTSMISHSRHRWRIPCLRTRIGEQWGHFLFYSLYSSYGLLGAGSVWGHLGSMEKTPVDGRILQQALQGS